MIRYLSIFIVWLLLISSSCIGQSRLSGVVTSTSDPVPGAWITAIQTNRDTIHAVTDSDGKYTIKVAKGGLLLTIASLGFKRYSIDLQIEDRQKTHDVQLEEDHRYLEEVPIWGNQEGVIQSTHPPVTSLDSRIWVGPTLLANTNAVNFRQFLTKLPGVTVYENQVLIRGGGGLLANNGSRVMVVVDGIPQLTPDYNDIQWGTIPTELVSGSTLIKGAGAVLFGSNALNGVISTSTIWPGEKPSTQVSVFYKSLDRYSKEDFNWWTSAPNERGLSVRHSSRLGKRVDLVLGANALEGTSYLKDVSSDQARLTWKLRYRPKQSNKGWSYGLTGSWLSANDFQFVAWNNDSTGINTSFTSSSDSSSSLIRFDRKILQVNPYAKYHNHNGVTHLIRGRYYGLRVTNYVFYPVTSISAVDYIFSKVWADKWSIRAGATAQSFLYRRIGLDTRYEGMSVTGFTQVKYDAPPWRASIGLRYEAFKSHEINWKGAPVLGVGVNYEISKAQGLRFNFNQGYRIPSILERFESQPNQAIPIYPNANLQVETGWTSEIGYRHQITPKLYFDGAFFVQDMTNLVDYGLNIFPPDSISPPYTVDQFQDYFGLQAQNISRTRFGGVDLSLNGSITLGKTPIRVLAGWMYVYPVDLEKNPAMNNWGVYLGSVFESMFSNNPYLDQAILINRQRALLKLDLETDIGNLTIGAAYLHQSAMEKIDPLFNAYIPNVADFRAAYPQYSTIINLRLGYQIGKYGRVTILGRNIFNKIYTLRPAKLEPPRNWTIQYRVEF